MTEEQIDALRRLIEQEIAECGGPCEQGPEHCDCGELWVTETKPEEPTDEELINLLPLYSYEDGLYDGFFQPGSLPSDWGDEDDYIASPRAILVFARAVLARWGNHPESPDRSGNLKAGLTRSPAAGEVAELVAWLRGVNWDRQQLLQIAIRAADLLERLSPLQPVPVSERLPEPGDCDMEGRCWTWAIGTWRLSRINRSFHTHWLPAHALPLPS